MVLDEPLGPWSEIHRGSEVVVGPGPVFSLGALWIAEGTRLVRWRRPSPKPPLPGSPAGVNPPILQNIYTTCTFTVDVIAHVRGARSAAPLW